MGMLETHQREIHEALLSIEIEAARMYQAISFPSLHPSACVHPWHK